MLISGRQLEELQKALLDAFPNRDDVRRLVRFGLDERLEQIAGGVTDSHLVFNLLEWAEVHGRLPALVEKAQTLNPGNELLASTAPVILAQCKRAEEMAGNQNPDLRRVVVCYLDEDPAPGLAKAIAIHLQGNGHSAFLVGPSVAERERWPRRADDELRQCDRFVLLLTPQVGTSELIVEIVSRVRQLQELRPSGQPVIIRVQVGGSTALPIHEDLDANLAGSPLQRWITPADTGRLVSEILWPNRKGTAATDEPDRSAPGIRLTGETPTQPTGFLSDCPGVDPGDRTRSTATLTDCLPPLPMASLEHPRGHVRLHSPFYVERPPVERDCREQLQDYRTLIHIRAPRQTGKTSLLARIMQWAQEEGHATFTFSLQRASRNVFEDAPTFFLWFTRQVARPLDLKVESDDAWTHDPMGACTYYFQETLIPARSKPLTLGLDEVDAIFQNPKLAEDFFGMLRAWNDEPNSDSWDRLRLVIVHSTEAYLSLDVNHSPFNVGLPVDLPDFNATQVSHLASLHGLQWGNAEVEQLIALVGGQPYLVRLALYRIARGEIELPELCRVAATDGGPYGDHLRRLVWILDRYPQLGRAMLDVVDSATPMAVGNGAGFQLESLGACRRVGDLLSPRCELYRQYLQKHLRGIPC